MSTTPSPGLPGYVSPNGMWVWDGQRWVPTGAQAAPAVRRSRAWIWWVAGGCAVLLLLGVAGGIYGMVSLIRTVQNGALSCLPSDFPRYPNATVTRVNTFVGTNVAPGDSNECNETLDSNDDVATVSDFYKTHLAMGDWTVSQDDSANGKIDFARASRPQTVGHVLLLGRGQHTTFGVTLDS